MEVVMKRIKLVCAHGIQDGEADVVDRFKLVGRIGAKWVPTVRGHSREETLRGDEPQVYPLAGPPDESQPLRARYAVRCGRCDRTLQLRDENLQALLNATAAESRDTLRLDKLA